MQEFFGTPKPLIFLHSQLLLIHSYLMKLIYYDLKYLLFIEPKSIALTVLIRQVEQMLSYKCYVAQ